MSDLILVGCVPGPVVGIPAIPKNMCVYLYLYMYICMHTHIYMYVYVFIYSFVC